MTIFGLDNHVLLLTFTIISAVVSNKGIVDSLQRVLHSTSGSTISKLISFRYSLIAKDIIVL